ncbi:MAG: hypothetical protein II165_06925, partial [Bacteroidales bacterium]|nr:hypothetical protein [Bacteroidales bacterium]
RVKISLHLALSRCNPKRECGLILSKYPEMDMISVGPNTFNVHTPTEKIEIASTQRFMKLLYETIENAPIEGGVWA